MVYEGDASNNKNAIQYDAFLEILKKQRKEKRKSRQRVFEESAVAFSAIEGIEESPFCEDTRVNVIKEAEEQRSRKKPR